MMAHKRIVKDKIHETKTNTLQTIKEENIRNSTFGLPKKMKKKYTSDLKSLKKKPIDEMDYVNQDIE